MTVNNIGPKIKKIRQERGWTQKQLAELLDFSESLLSYIENGVRSFDVKISTNWPKFLKSLTLFFWMIIILPTLEPKLKTKISRQIMIRLWTTL